eukprot:symbB.v1.2.040727.t1/scaffold7474.1/size11042/1
MSVVAEFKVVVSFGESDDEVMVKTSPSTTLENFLQKTGELIDFPIEDCVLLAVDNASGAWYPKMKSGDESIEAYLSFNELEIDTSHFLVISVESYNTNKYEAGVKTDDESSSESYTSTDGESDGEDDDDDDDDRKNSGDDRDGLGRGGGSGGDGASSNTHFMTSAGYIFPKSIESDVKALIDEHFALLNKDTTSICKEVEKLIEATDDIHVLKALCGNIKGVAGILLGLMEKSKEKMNNIENEKKKKQRAEKKAQKDLLKKEASKQERETEITFNVKIEGNTGTSPVKVRGDMTVATMRNQIHQTLLVGLSKKVVKMARITTSAGVDMCENPRATIKSFKLVDGAVLDFQFQARGGGKRGASSISKSKEQVLQLLSEEVLNGVMRLSAQNNVSPVIEDVKAKIQTINNAIIANPSGVVSDLIKEIPDDTIRRLSVEVLTSSTKVEGRAKTMTQVVFNQEHRALNEVSIQCQKSNELLVKTIQYALMSQFADEHSNVSWSKFSELLTTELSKRVQDFVAKKSKDDDTTEGKGY